MILEGTKNNYNAKICLMQNCNLAKIPKRINRTESNNLACKNKKIQQSQKKCGKTLLSKHLNECWYYPNKILVNDIGNARCFPPWQIFNLLVFLTIVSFTQNFSIFHI